MKKIILIVLVLVLLISLAACSVDDFFDEASAPEAVSNEAWVAEDAAPETEVLHSAILSGRAAYGDGTLFGVGGAPQLGRDRAFAEDADAAPEPSAVTISADKIIHEASATIQTENFDATITQVYDLVDELRGFIQRSNIEGTEEEGGRRADFSLRIPNRSYRAMTEAISGLGIVSRFNSSATNVAAQYADITARLASLRTQEARILAMLEQATTLSEMLDLEARLGELIFQIERFTSERNDLDQQIAYSTVDLWIIEVEDEDEIVDEEGEDDPTTAGDVFSASIEMMRTVGRTLLFIVVAIAPWALVIAVITLPVLWLVLWRKKK